jgi:hypothetical protein
VRLLASALDREPRKHRGPRAKAPRAGDALRLWGHANTLEGRWNRVCMGGGTWHSPPPAPASAPAMPGSMLVVDSVFRMPSLAYMRMAPLLALSTSCSFQTTHRRLQEGQDLGVLRDHLARAQRIALHPNPAASP